MNHDAALLELEIRLMGRTVYELDYQLAARARPGFLRLPDVGVLIEAGDDIGAVDLAIARQASSKRVSAQDEELDVPILS